MGHVPAVQLQCQDQRLFFGIFERVFTGLGRLDRRQANNGRQVLKLDDVALAQRRQGTQHRAQLAHVARPREPQQRLTRRRGDPQPLPGRLFSQQKVQQLRFVRALAQRRQADFQPVEAVKKVFAETAVGHTLLQIAVGGTDDAHVDCQRLATNGHHQPVFQHP